ncbi:MAG: hypothetical protein ACLT3Y_03030 [Ruminococcus callidus]
MKIWNATIHTMTDAGILENGYVCIENGKITEVGTGTPSVLAPEDIDAGVRFCCRALLMRTPTWALSKTASPLRATTATRRPTRLRHICV